MSEKLSVKFRNLFIVLPMLLVSAGSLAQEATVEKSIYGIQTGLIGIWAHNESRLSNTIALRSEIGLNLGYYTRNSGGDSRYALIPVITAEPRWYYNLSKRAAKSKSTANNTANFISLNTSFHPDWFYISNDNNVEHLNAISIIPTWGIRRVLGRHFTYESGLGIGYFHIIPENNVYVRHPSGVALNLHVRIGYKF